MFFWDFVVNYFLGVCNECCLVYGRDKMWWRIVFEEGEELIIVWVVMEVFCFGLI